MKRDGVFIIAVIAVSLLIGACGDKEDVNTALLKAAEEGNAGKVNELLEKGADVNSMDEYNRSPLMLAAYNGHSKVVDSLIKAGADIYAKAKFGQTAFGFASEQGHANIVELIRAAQVITAPDAPPTKGPYSHAMVWEDLIFVSGQGPIDRTTGEVMHGDILEEMAIAVENIRIILEAADSGLENVLKVTVYLADMNDLDRMNEKYKEYFGPVFPALTAIQADIPFDVKIEIDVVAHKK
jgi:2-iminobutanoate/2-iminopropanoate deaminase